jgi:hypothetical protein
VIDSPLPQALEDSTLFSRLGDWSVLILLIATFTVARIVRRAP